MGEAVCVYFVSGVTVREIYAQAANWIYYPQEINGYDFKGHTIQDSVIGIFLNTQLAPSAKIR